MSSLQSQPYEIDRPTGVCAMSGRTLEPGDDYIATLTEEGEALTRLDIALDAWEAGQRPEQMFSYWKATVPEPNTKRKMFVDDAVLMNLLDRLADAEQPQRIAFRFVLMLILMRKKLLRYDRTDRRELNAAGGESSTSDEAQAATQARAATEEWWVLTPKLDPSKGPLGKWNDQVQFEVLDPRLTDEQVKEVTDQLGEILNAEL